MFKTQGNTFSTLLLRAIFFLLCILLTTHSWAQIADKIIAVVDNKIVLQSDIQLQLNQMVAQNVPVNQASKCNLYQQLLIQKLMVVQANHDSLVVSNEEIENELDRRMNYFISQVGSKEKFEEYYHKPILKFKEEFRDAVQEQLLAQRMQQKILGESKVSPVEIKKYFEAIPADSLPYIGAEYEFGQIIISPKPSFDSKLEAKNQLKLIKEKIENGVSFESQAKLYSEDPGSAIKGGDLGLVGRGEMVPEFEAALFKLKDGQLSDIVETQYGYHLIKMIAKQGEKAKAKHILISPKSTSNDLMAAAEKLDSIRKKIVADSLTFKQAADKFSTDEQTKTNGGMFQNPNDGSSMIEAQSIESDLFFVIDTMKLNQISKVQLIKTREGKDAVRIVLLKSKTQAHKANLKDDYAKLQQAAINKKQQDKMTTWVKKTISKNYIVVDDEFKKCDEIKTMWLKNNN